jgi:hypothetical protein
LLRGTTFYDEAYDAVKCFGDTSEGCINSRRVWATKTTNAATKFLEAYGALAYCGFNLAAITVLQACNSHAVVSKHRRDKQVVEFVFVNLQTTLVSKLLEHLGHCIRVADNEHCLSCLILQDVVCDVLGVWWFHG